MHHGSEPYASDVAAWFAAATSMSADSFGGRLFGATTATILPFIDDSGFAYVAKIYDRDIPGVGTSDVERDATAMTAAAESGLATPRVIASDPDGKRLGHPALIMTRLHGDPLAFGGDDPNGWTDGLADALIAIATAPLPTTDLPRYRSWVPNQFTMPAWSGNRHLWDAVSTALGKPLPASQERLIHRDFHQLNVLWANQRTTGTVDWVNGCLGPIESDMASARVNIALADRRYDGIALADRFLQRCLEAGLPWHPRWDIDFIAGVVDRPEVFLVGCDFGADMTVSSVRDTLEAMADSAITKITKT